MRRYRLRSARGRISFAVHFWAIAVFIPTRTKNYVCAGKLARTDVETLYAPRKQAAFRRRGKL